MAFSLWYKCPVTTESSDWVAEHEARKNWVNKLFYGDNLDVLRDRLAPETVDLVYLDPPFNSNRSYNVLFGHKRSPDDRAQIEAFDDTWTWTQETERLYFDLINGGCRRGHRDLRSVARRWSSVCL